LADQEAIDLAASPNVAFSMDVYNGDHIRAVGEEEGWPEEFIRKNNETTDAQRDVFSRALAAGVPITFGTDAAVYPHGNNARQFSIMVRHGMSPMQAIKSATSVAAKYIGWEDRVGSIKQGLFADIIAVRGDPLMDITLLQDVQVVVKGGALIKSERINK
jgi:imidazolonepropionase-like amidohydrolase